MSLRQLEQLEHLARKLRAYPQWVAVVRAAAKTIRHQEIRMATEANILAAYKAALATATAADAAKDAQIADLSAKLAEAQTGGKDAADVAAEQQAIADLDLNADGTSKVTPAAPPATPPGTTDQGTATPPAAADPNAGQQPAADQTPPATA